MKPNKPTWKERTQTPDAHISSNGDFPVNKPSRTAFRPGRVCCFGWKETVLVVNCPEATRVCTKKYAQWGFGYGESAYEVSIGLASRSGDTQLHPLFRPSDSPIQLRHSEQSKDANLQNLESVEQSLMSRSIQKKKKSKVRGKIHCSDLVQVLWVKRGKYISSFELLVNSNNQNTKITRQNDENE